MSLNVSWRDSATHSQIGASNMDIDLSRFWILKRIRNSFRFRHAKLPWNTSGKPQNFDQNWKIVWYWFVQMFWVVKRNLAMVAMGDGIEELGCKLSWNMIWGELETDFKILKPYPAEAFQSGRASVKLTAWLLVVLWCCQFVSKYELKYMK